MEDTKVCKDCGECLVLSRFESYKSTTKPGGLGYRSICKDCRNKSPTQEVVEGRMESAKRLGSKTCGRCKQRKPVDLFNFNKEGRKAGTLRPKCRPCEVDVAREWNVTHREAVNLTCRSYYRRHRLQILTGPGKDRKNHRTRLWRSSHPDYVRESAARRRSAKLTATPSWADRVKILSIYKEAVRLTAETGIEHHVDHLVPLRSKYVCGLHCEANLAVTTGHDNLVKLNTWWPDMSDITPETELLAKTFYAEAD